MASVDDMKRFVFKLEHPWIDRAVYTKNRNMRVFYAPKDLGALSLTPLDPSVAVDEMMRRSLITLVPEDADVLTFPGSTVRNVGLTFCFYYALSLNS